MMPLLLMELTSNAGVAVSVEYVRHGPDGRSGTVVVTSITVPDQAYVTQDGSVITVAADVARTLIFTEADGVRPGRYEKIRQGYFRLQESDRY